MANKRLKKTKKFVFKDKAESGTRTARGLGIVSLIIYIIAVIIGFAFRSVYRAIPVSICIVSGLIMSAIALDLYHKYGKDNGFDSFICVINWIPVGLVWIILFIAVAIMESIGTNDSSSKKAETKKIGDGYVEEGEYGTYYMYVNNGAGCDKISLKDYNSRTGDALDFDGNSYKIG